MFGIMCIRKEKIQKEERKRWSTLDHHLNVIVNFTSCVCNIVNVYLGLAPGVFSFVF